jgi:hypothetical protein
MVESALWDSLRVIVGVRGDWQDAANAARAARAVAVRIPRAEMRIDRSFIAWLEPA